MNANAFLTVPLPRARFSSAEFLHMLASDAFHDIAVELIDGELERMPPPGNAHRRWQIAIVARLLRLLPEDLVCAEIGIDLGTDTIVAADAAVLEHRIEGDGMLLASALALVVEVAVSTRDRDLGLKRRLYAAAGIPTYWVIDADRAMTHVFARPEGGDYLALSLVRFAEPLAVPRTAESIVLA